MDNILKYIKVDVENTLGKEIYLLEAKPYYTYVNGVKSDQAGISYVVLLPNIGYSKSEIKVPNISTVPFDIAQTPMPVQVIGAEIRIYQNWSANGAVNIAITAKEIRPISSQTQKLKVNITDKQ